MPEESRSSLGFPFRESAFFSGIPGAGALIFLRDMPDCVWIDRHRTQGCFLADALNLFDRVFPDYCPMTNPALQPMASRKKRREGFFVFMNATRYHPVHAAGMHHRERLRSLSGRRDQRRR